MPPPHRRLDSAALHSMSNDNSENGGWTCLELPCFVTLSHITLECPKPGWAHVEGFALSTSPARQDGSRVSDRNTEIQF